MTDFIKKILFGKSNTLSENIILCIAVSMASAFIYYDLHNGYMEIVRIILAVLILAAWIMGAFSAGKSKQWGFLIFTGVYWILPRLYMIYYADRDNLRDYCKWLSLLNKSADIVVNKPFQYLCDNLGESVMLFTVILLTFTVSAYCMGGSFKSMLEEKKQEPTTEDR